MNPEIKTETDIPQYTVITGDGLKIVPLTSIASKGSLTAHIEQPTLPNPVTNVFAAFDSSKGGTNPPDMIRLENLSGQYVKNMSANAGSITAVTEGHRVIVSQTCLVDDHDPDIKFVQMANYDLLEVLTCASGLEHTILIATEGQKFVVLGMGNNNFGQLGLPGTDFSQRFRPLKFPSQPRFVEVVCGPYSTYLLTDLAEVWAFGYNAHGQLGIMSNEKIVFTPTFCDCLYGVPSCQIAAGLNHSFVLTTTGLVFGAGSNKKGQLNSPTTEDTPQFKLVEFLSTVFIVFIAARENNSAAIDESGTLYLWGEQFGEPRLISCAQKFVEVCIGDNGRVAAITNMKRLYIVCETMPMEIRHPNLPFFRIFTGGEYFLIVAGSNPQFQLRTLTSDKSLPAPESKGKIVEKLRQPVRSMIITPSNIPDILMLPAIRRIVGLTFSSLSTVNGSFILDNFNESMSDVYSGIDCEALIRSYNFLVEKNQGAMSDLTNAFATLLCEVSESPPAIRRPITLRWTLLALMVPSVKEFRAGYDLWHATVKAITTCSMGALLVQWLTVIGHKYLRRIVNNMKEFLSAVISQIPLYSTAVRDTVTVFDMVWRANTRTRVLPFDAFYNEQLNKSIDIRAEYDLQKSKQWCFVSTAPWLLSADTKTRFARLHARLIMNQQQQESLAHARQFWGTTPVVTPNDLFLIIEVNRTSVLQDTFLAISRIKDLEIDLKKPLKVIFKNEPGVDEGGVQREFFELIVNEIFDPERGFFTHSGDVVWFSQSANDPTSLQAFMLLGIVFGLAIYNGNLLNVRFPTVCYRMLKNQTIMLNDLEELDQQLYTTLKNILEYDGDVAEMDLAYEYMGHELIADGNNTPITNANREEYVEAVAKWIIQGSVKEQFDSFKFGFMQSAGNLVLSLFRPEELGLLIAGREELDFVALESNTRYENYNAESPTIRTFWKIVHTQLNDEEKKKLLYFVTSSPRAPINGLGSLPFVIARDGDPKHLPTSHTCFFMLVLPDDPDEERMLKNLRIALDNAEGFQFK